MATANPRRDAVNVAAAPMPRLPPVIKAMGRFIQVSPARISGLGYNRNPLHQRQLQRSLNMGQFINLTAKDGFVFPAYVAEPAGTPKGAVVVVQEIFGVNSH